VSSSSKGIKKIISSSNIHEVKNIIKQNAPNKKSHLAKIAMLQNIYPAKILV